MSVRLAYHANCWGPLGGDAVGVTSIGALAYRTFADMSRAVEDIAAAGYSGVEFFDGNLLDYETRQGEMRATLADAGLTLVAAYSGANFIFRDIIEQELAKIRRTAEVAAALGAEHLVVGGGAKRLEGVQADDHKRLAEGLERVVQIAKAKGLAAHYHPHLTTIVEGPAEVDAIFALTSIGFCPDTAHLAAAGGDVAAMIRKHKDRVSYVHLKGWRKEPFAFTPLDQGDLDVSAILGALQAIGYGGWITTELDAWPDPKAGATQSFAYLKQHLPQS
jgi:inosose dehydratase